MENDPQIEQQIERLKTAIRQALDAGRFTQRSLSRAAGMSEAYVGQVLRDETQPKPKSIEAICDALGISYEYVMSGRAMTPRRAEAFNLLAQMTDEEIEAQVASWKAMRRGKPFDE